MTATLAAVISIIGGLFLLTIAGDKLVDGAVTLGKKYKWSDIFIGIVVIGFGTSLPEMVAGVVAARAESAPLVLGNMVGSNIANIGLVLGIGLLVVAGMKGTKHVIFDYMLMLIGTFIFLVALDTGEGISSMEGVLLILALNLLIIGSYFYMVKKGEMSAEIEFDTSLDSSILKAYFWVLVGIVGLYIGAELLVNGAIEVAQSLGVSERIIGLTIVAVGTSLPELAATISAAKKSNLGMVLGNVCGSNLFNLLAAVGLAAVIYPLSADGMQLDMPVLGLFTVLMGMLFFAENKRYLRVCGIVLLALYACYIGSLWVS